jgi:hypothetical protein
MDVHEVETEILKSREGEIKKKRKTQQGSFIRENEPLMNSDGHG